MHDSMHQLCFSVKKLTPLRALNQFVKLQKTPKRQFDLVVEKGPPGVQVDGLFWEVDTSYKGPKHQVTQLCRSSTGKLKTPKRAETAGTGCKSRLLSAPVLQRLFIVFFNWKVLSTTQEPVNFPQNVQTQCPGKRNHPMLSCSTAGKAANNRPFPTSAQSVHGTELPHTLDLTRGITRQLAQKFLSVSGVSSCGKNQSSRSNLGRKSQVLKLPKENSKHSRQMGEPKNPKGPKPTANMKTSDPSSWV